MVRMSAAEGMEVIGIGSVLVELLALSVRAYGGFLMNVSRPDRLGGGVSIPSLVLSRFCPRNPGIRSRGAVRSGSKPGKVEPMLIGAVGNFLGQISIIPTRGRFAVRLGIAQAEVPFPHHRGGIALRTKEGREGGAVLFDQGIALYTSCL